MKSFLDLHEDLRQWFDPKHPKGGWKRINSKGEAIGPCARKPGEAKPKCMSNEKRAKLSKKERASAVRAKRKHDPNPEIQCYLPGNQQQGQRLILHQCRHLGRPLTPSAILQPQHR